MKIALASPPFPKSMVQGLYWLEKLVKEAVEEQAEIICFPESYLPGYPGMGCPPKDRTHENLQAALNSVCKIAAENSITVIVPMDWHSPIGLVNMAYVVSEKGEVLGYQRNYDLS